MLSLTYKRFDGVVSEPGTLDAEDRALLEKVEAGFETVGELYNACRFCATPVRRAFAHALDRERMANVAFGGYRYPATGGFVPQGMPGHSPRIGLPYDPERARVLLAEAGYPNGRGFPELDFLPPPGGPIEFNDDLRAQLRDNLSVEYRLELAAWATFFDRLGEDAPHMLAMGWAASYPDPDNHPRAGFPWQATGWRHEAYENLVEDARRSVDQAERLNLRVQTDKIFGGRSTDHPPDLRARAHAREAVGQEVPDISLQNLVLEGRHHRAALATRVCG